jgi:hypothetical protein
MKPEDLIKGKIYVYGAEKERLIFDHSWTIGSNGPNYRFFCPWTLSPDQSIPKPSSWYLNAQEIENLIPKQK